MPTFNITFINTKIPHLKQSQNNSLNKLFLKPHLHHLPLFLIYLIQLSILPESQKIGNSETRSKFKKYLKMKTTLKSSNTILSKTKLSEKKKTNKSRTRKFTQKKTKKNQTLFYSY